MIDLIDSSHSWAVQMGSNDYNQMGEIIAWLYHLTQSFWANFRSRAKINAITFSGCSDLLNVGVYADLFLILWELVNSPAGLALYDVTKGLNRPVLRTFDNKGLYVTVTGVTQSTFLLDMFVHGFWIDLRDASDKICLIYRHRTTGQYCRSPCMNNNATIWLGTSI